MEKVQKPSRSVCYIFQPVWSPSNALYVIVGDIVTLLYTVRPHVDKFKFKI
jgi:hypothetical protein